MSKQTTLHGMIQISAALAGLMLATGVRAETAAVTTLDTSAFKVYVDGLQGPEGPSVLPDGSVAMVEFVLGNVVRIDAAGKKEVLASTGSGPVGTVLGKDGALYVVKLNPGAMTRMQPAGDASANGGMSAAPAPQGPEGMNGGMGDGMGEGKDGPPANGGRTTLQPSPASVFKIDLKTKQVQTLYTKIDGQELAGPDDLVVDQWGDLWFTDMFERSVYWARSDGSHLRRVITNVPGVNGITLAPDHKRFYIIANGKLVAYDITARGELAIQNGLPKVTEIATLDPTKGMPDGMKTEANGNILLGCGEDGIITYAPDGKLVSQVKIAGKRVVNMAFGGKNNKTLYLAVNASGSMSGSLISIAWPRAGLK